MKWLWLFVLPGCAFISDSHEDWRLDPDEDGVPVGEDCNDADPQIGAARAWYPDADGDGIGRQEDEQILCIPPEGSVTAGGDCDDSDDTTFPNADERCDGADNDCDGEIDEGVLTPFWPDSDNDGYGSPTGRTEACEAPS
ncbi:MAG: putative metal-binding motif-containing protein, partial [Myxococcota bacterium]